MFQGILLILFGAGMEAVAFFVPQFYARKGWFAGDRPVSRWKGQALFGVIGLALMLIGMRQLIAS